MSGPCLFSRPRRIRRGAALACVFVTVLTAGAATGAWPGEDGTTPPRPTESAVGVADEDVVKAAAEAMADGKSGTKAAEEVVSRSGDRWGAVYDKDEYEEFEQALDGRYTGVGLRAARTGDGRIEVARVQDGGPAQKAGIRSGDRLRTVDGRPVADLPVTEVVALLRGERAKPGTPVQLGMERAARGWTVTVRRAHLETENVTVERLPTGAVLIKVSAFTKGAGDEVRAALGTAPARAGLVLDLRGNSGGLVTEAVTAASALLDGGLVATYDVRGEQRALHAEPGGDTDRPVVALVDGGTMSAAELLTGALQDRGRAVVVGSRTFGKGSVQMPSRLPDGSVAELTVGHYRTPSGRAVDGRGITPDLEARTRVTERAEEVMSGLGPAS